MFVLAAFVTVLPCLQRPAATPMQPPITTVVQADARLAAVRESLIAKVRAGRIPSVALSVSEGGRAIWEEAIGWADRERHIPATPATSYALGSLSKSLASVAVLALVQRGVLSLDAPIDRWVRLPTPTGVRTQPTLRQLLDASGGVPHGWRDAPLADVPASRAAWDRWITENAFLAFPPGVVFEYSNNSFGVAARVAERAVGVPFPDVLQHYLFEPLGMRLSHAGNVARVLTASARRYSSDGRPFERKALVPEAGLGLFASAADLARFGAFVRRDGDGTSDLPLSAATRAMLWRPATGPSGDFFHFGFWNGGRALVTTGNIEGANAHLAIGRHTDVVVAVVVNQTGNDADAAAGAILRVLIPVEPGAPDLRAAYDDLYRRRYRAPEGLEARWVGALLAGGRAVPFALNARADSVLVRIDKSAWTPLERPRLSAFGVLRGSLAAPVSGLAASSAGTARVDIVLAWEGATLRGYALPRGATAQPLAIELHPVPAPF
jgi:CubicO group peptidase (beta-lactamase class C family)